MNQNMFTLEDAVALAARAHKGQVDKAGAPYILHPLRVMQSMTSMKSMMTGVLHDVIEDTSYDMEDLRELGCPADVLEALDCLTKRETEKEYEQFIRRILDSGNAIALQVKIADIRDNLDPARTQYLEETKRRRLTNKYVAALKLLKYSY